ncbi:MAG: NUDIX domain-containing protein [Nanoarchaeota archaeon]
MKTYAIVVGIVKIESKILILKRNPTKRFDPKAWEFVSGFIKDHQSAENTMLREVKEETGLDGELIKSAKSFEVNDKYGRWIIIPFLIKVNSNNIKVNPAEHTEFKWIDINEIDKFETVADLKKDLKVLGLI